jgi:hypothetical protein
MAERMDAASFHLSYNGEEDRLLIAVDVASDRRYGMALPRRLVKLMLGALADMHAGRRGDSYARDPMVRDTLLSFEHSHAVAQGLSSGETKPDTERRPLVAAPLVVRTIKLVPQPHAGVTVTFDDTQRVISVEMSAQRLHRFMAGVLDLAAGAGWDLPQIAAWLDRASTEAAPSPRVLQ